MKKNTVKMLFLAVTAAGSISAFAQTPAQKQKMLKETNVADLKVLAERLDKEYHEKKAEALRLAKINNWPVEIYKDGNIAKLMEVTKEGNPIYYTTYNVGSAITSRTNFLQPGGDLNLDLTGAGLTVGVWDGDYPLTSHVDLIGRFYSNDGSPFPSAAHPTHVLGTIMGSGISNSQAKGMATEAEGVVYDFDNDFAEMATQAEFASLLVSNHSYGLVATDVPQYYFGAYIDMSKQVDQITFNFPYYQPVFAAGNDGDGSYDKLTARCTAKNGIVVGAVNQVLDYQGPESVSIANFSNWGPTDDRRVKPDVVTKGVAVRSCTNTSNTATTEMNGTSMSTPGISGTLLLLQQHYSNVHDGDFMKSATVRGLVAHTADEAGTEGPDPIYGYGLMNAKFAAETISKTGTTAIMDERVLLPAQTYTVTVHALGTEPLIATLAWTDPPGNINNGTNNLTTPVLVNNLDIKIQQNTDVFYPWRLANTASSPAFQDVNNVDNLEKIQIEEPSGNYTITVSHKGATLVNPGGTPQQQYSLIVTGINFNTTGVDDVKSETFKVWPNPAKGQINISMTSGLEQNAAVTIHDMRGRTVYSNGINTMESTINTEGFSAGVYMVNVTNGDKQQVKKVVIQ